MAAPDVAVRTNEDDFMSNLGSMDEAQLTALLQEITDRGNYRFGIADATTMGGRPELRRQAFSDPTKVYGDGPGDIKAIPDIALKSASLSHQYKTHMGRNKDKKKRAQYNKALNAESVRQKDLLSQRLRMVQNQLGTVKLRNKTNQQFRDMELGGLFDKMTKQGLDKNILGITQQHQDLSRETGFQAVGQGLGGSSVDAERVSDIGASQDQAMIQAAAQAQQQRGDLTRSLDTQRRSLIDGISGSNPGEEARLSGELQGIRQGADEYAGMLGARTYGMGLDQQQMAGQSQALGGLLSNYARLYTQTSRQ